MMQYNTREPEIKNSENPSPLWYLLPLLLGAVGGSIAAYFVMNRNIEFAKKLLIIGIIMTVFLPIIITFLAWTWMVSYILHIHSFA